MNSRKILNRGAVSKLLPGLLAVVGIAAGVVSARSTPQTQMPDIQVPPPATIGDPNNESYSTEFKHEYDSWKSTSQMGQNTKYAGSGFRDYLADDTKLVVLFAGYPFSAEYNQARGHVYAIDDVTNTKRRNPNTPATCWSCKSPGVPVAMLKDGVRGFYGSKFDKYIGEMKNPIGCADCHELKTMKLQVSRPGLLEGFKAMGKDIAKASQEEMRSLVCAQCHVEYHFKGQDKYLKFPWDNGLKAEDFDKYYEAAGFTDWTHTISGAKMVKMQHPDYEVFQQSLHGKRGVSCADCHMPKKSEGDKDYTDHQIQSPLYMPERTCGKCHDWTNEQVKDRVTEIQDRNREMLDRAERVLTAAHLEIGDAKKLGATDDELLPVRKLVSKAQMYWDYVAAANGMGFHAPQESSRVLGKSVDLGQECRLQTQALRAKHGAMNPIEMPDISTKEKAQAFIKTFLPPAK